MAAQRSLSFILLLFVIQSEDSIATAAVVAADAVKCLARRPALGSGALDGGM